MFYAIVRWLRKLGCSLFLLKDISGSFLTLFNSGFPLIFVAIISCRIRDLLGRASLV